MRAGTGGMGLGKAFGVLLILEHSLTSDAPTHAINAIHVMWPRGVMVSTLDSESGDRGSNPREAFSQIETGIGTGTSDKIWGLQSG